LFSPAKKRKEIGNIHSCQCHRRKQQFYAKTQKTHGESHPGYFSSNFDALAKSQKSLSFRAAARNLVS